LFYCPGSIATYIPVKSVGEVAGIRQAFRKNTVGQAFILSYEIKIGVKA
jgi:hypothetical protein